MAESVSSTLDPATGGARISTLYARGVFGLVAASTVLALITANGCHLYLVSHDSAAPVELRRELEPTGKLGVAFGDCQSGRANSSWLV
jgi:hypothetical protein